MSDEFMSGLRCSVPENENTRREMLKMVEQPDYRSSFELACFEITGLRNKRDELLALMRMIASISHMGGLEKMSESEALTAIRRATMTYFDAKATDEQHRSSIRAMKGGAR